MDYFYMKEEHIFLEKKIIHIQQYCAMKYKMVYNIFLRKKNFDLHAKYKFYINFFFFQSLKKSIPILEQKHKIK